MSKDKIRIKMLKTKKGSEDGCSVNVYEEGKFYVIDRSLAKVFIDNDWARRHVKKEVGEEDVEENVDEETGEVKPREDDDQRPESIQITKPSLWVGRTLRSIEDGKLKKVESVQGNQVFFEGETVGVDYRTVRKTMEVT